MGLYIFEVQITLNLSSGRYDYSGYGRSTGKVLKIYLDDKLEWRFVEVKVLNSYIVIFL